MYEKINFTKELKQIPQNELLRFLSSQLKKNELLQKEFIKRFNLSIQQKFIQDYVEEFEIALKKCKKSIGRGEYFYDHVKFNKDFLNQKISYLKVLEKQKETLEALKLCLIIYYIISKVSLHNSNYEYWGSNTTAEKYENRWEKMKDKLCELYLQLDHSQYYLFDRKTFFNILLNLNISGKTSYAMNFIFVREHIKLEWFRKILRDEDKDFLKV